LAQKSDFTPEDWRKIIEAPLLAGFAVGAAEPGGLLGALQESMASAQALADARADPGACPLVAAVAQDLFTAKGRSAARDGVQRLIEGAADFPEIRLAALERLREVRHILDAHAPDDAGSFKRWLCHVAETVAEAAPEGGFLGFGGERVSAAERETLGEIAAALGI
jgi:hypothetical protein